jgi:hypothetical protein
MKLENWQIAKNLIQMIENLEARKVELTLLLNSIERDSLKRIYISMDNYPSPDHKVPLYNDEKIIELVKFQLEETKKLLDQRKKEFNEI